MKKSLCGMYSYLFMRNKNAACTVRRERQTALVGTCRLEFWRDGC